MVTTLFLGYTKLKRFADHNHTPMIGGIVSQIKGLRMAKSLTKLREEQAKLEAAIKEAEEKEALRIGKLALGSGLLDLNISDSDWKNIFQEAGARFRQKTKEPVGQTSS